MALSCFLALPTVVYGQSSDDALNNFRAEVIKQRFIVQGFSADATTKFQWTGAGLSLSPPKLRTLGLLSPESVKLRGGEVYITGKRHTLIKLKDGRISAVGNAASTIIVDLQGADPATVLPKLKSQLFFPTLESAMAAIPGEYARFLPATTDANLLTSSNSQPADAQRSCLPGAKYSLPSVTNREDPEFTEDARQAHIHGAVRIVFTVDDRGHTENLWLAIPLGLGLDENAARAVSHYTFKPAKCDDLPVKTQMIMDIGFDIY